MTESPLSSTAARKLSKLGASKGGTARANTLTPEERSDIARKAVRARWQKAGKVDNTAVDVGGEQVSSDPVRREDANEQNHKSYPIALFPGKVKLGDGEFLCYVLDNGKRVLSQREVVRALTGQSKGEISRYLESQNMQPYINKELVADQTIQFAIPANPVVGIGYEATLLLDICDAYLRARLENALVPHQLHLAKQAEIITRACAKIGIIALIDEATGYQAFRKKQELQLKLQAFIAEDMQEWARMFQEEFWYELARLEGIHYSARSRPLRWGKYVMAFVYDAIDGDVGKTLREKNPDPHYQQNHHQWLKDFGRQKVHDQIERVITIMKLCTDMADFREKFAKVFKKSAVIGQMNFDWEHKA